MHRVRKLLLLKSSMSINSKYFCRPNSFVIITANRVIHCNSDIPEEMHHWISLLQKPKGESRVDGQEFLVRGKGAGSTDGPKICLVPGAEKLNSALPSLW